MVNTMNKSPLVEKAGRTPRSLSTRAVAKLLSVTMAVSAAVSGCADDQGIIGPSLVSANMDGGDGSIGMPGDSTSTVDVAGDVTTTTDGETASAEVDMAGDASVSTTDTDTTDTIDSAVKETSSTTTDTGTLGDTGSAAGTDTGSSAATDTGTTVVAVDTGSGSAVDAGTVAVDASSSAAEVSTSKIDTSSDTIPSGPKQICETAKAKMIAALNPGAPECTETIPGVGKVAGKLVCDGTNLEPNCEVN